MAVAEADARQDPPEINVDNLSSLLRNMNRLLVGLGSIPPFKNSNVGLGDWVALSALKDESLTQRQLARDLGVPRNRVDQIVEALSKENLISVVKSAEDPTSGNINITEMGKTRLAAINSELIPVLGSALKHKGKTLAGADRRVKALMPILRLRKRGKERPRVEKQVD